MALKYYLRCLLVLLCFFSPLHALQRRSDGSTISKSEFNAAVSKWKQQNPHLANSTSDEQIENVWQSINGKIGNFGNSSSLAGNFGNSSSLTRRSMPEAIRKRSNVTQTELDNARAIVSAAVLEAGKSNKERLANPIRNNYTTDTSSKLSRRDGSASLTINATVAAAAALVAEADMAALYKNGTQSKNYTLPGKYAKYNGPGTPTHASVKKRDTADYWLADILATYPGTQPFGDDAGYVVYRNVMDYGAVGDGVTDDTAAINAAIADGGRCGAGCESSSVKGAVVYFPTGTYLVSTPIIAMYNTQMIGNVNSLPVIQAAPSFVGLGVITSDVYEDGGSEWYINQSNFYRQIRNFYIDLEDCETDGVAGIHWQVAQATSLQNIYTFMSYGSSSTQIGIFAENGSGGFMSDLTFYGGNIGIECGNQQFTSRNLVFIEVNTAIYMLWDWGWTWKSLSVEDCQYGIYFDSAIAGGSIYVLDSSFSSVSEAAIYISSLDTGETGQQVLVNVDNMVLLTTPVAILDVNSGITFEGGSTTIDSITIGKEYSSDDDGVWLNSLNDGAQHPITERLMGGPNDGYFEKSRPQYEDTTIENWVSALALAAGDGSTDDTSALSFMISLSVDLRLGLFIPAGSYIITSTIVIPEGSVIVGSCWSQLVASGAFFTDMANPVPMLIVGEAESYGTLELSDLLFTSVGALPGLILVEWNIAESSQGAAGMWDCHFRVGGALGTDLQVDQCPITSTSASCIGASLMMYVSADANGYFENVWAWTADHDLDDAANTQVNIFTARGILIESTGPCWFYGTASEHSILYQYNLNNAADIVMSLIQTESPYFAPLVSAPGPFSSSVGLFNNDPDFSLCDGNALCEMAWGLVVTSSDNIQILGAGLYSWFYDSYSQACVDTQNCQSRMVNVTESDLYLFNLFTIGSAEMLSSFLSLSPDVNATDNTVQNIHPYLSAISTWIGEDYTSPEDDVGGDGSSSDGICDTPAADADLTSEASLRHVGEFLETYLTETVACAECGTLSYQWNWQSDLWGVDPSESDSACQLLASDDCDVGGTCDSYTNSDLYWARTSIANFNAWMREYYALFLGQTLNQSLLISEITTDFPVNTPTNLASEAAMMSAFGAALSTWGGYLGALPDAGPAVGATVSMVGSTLSLASSKLAGETDTTNAELVLQSRLSNVLTSFTSSMESAMSQMMLYGDLDSWPSALFPGNYENKIADFFSSGTYLLGPSTLDESTASAQIGLYLNQYLVGSALTTDNWYIAAGAYTTEASCTAVTGGLWINDLCYNLEKPANGYSDSDASSATYTKNLDSDTYSLITSKYQIALTDLYTSSINCQAQTNAYESVKNFTFDLLTFTTATPDCYYNLPVLSMGVFDLADDGVFSGTPCNILSNNKTATETTVGVSYLPDNLQNIFADNNFCCALESKEIICAANL